MAGFFEDVGDFLFGTEPEIMTKEVRDPIKTAVSQPLSSFLSSKIGKGLPKYGGELYSEIDPQAESRYKEFMSLDAPTFFEEKVAQPAIRRFREDLLPDIKEGFAGSLRGSGRVGTELQAISKFSSDLAEKQGQFELSLPVQQLSMASKRKAQLDADFTKTYKEWYKSLPEMNPVLEQALGFLGSPTGVDVLTATDPGTEGSFIDLIKIGADIATFGI